MIAQCATWADEDAQRRGSPMALPCSLRESLSSSRRRAKHWVQAARRFMVEGSEREDIPLLATGSPAVIACSTTTRWTGCGGRNAARVPTARRRPSRNGSPPSSALVYSRMPLAYDCAARKLGRAEAIGGQCNFHVPVWGRTISRNDTVIRPGRSLREARPS
ncbi:hypothetical protein PsYK624_008590 [Phanerochaete sordida]|uniref:Uncharacterized protein n=1 Tax=Phanerochaete sordida TaxID=48140 RepID=A0A9P3FX80_9APHY|nr:hypothetical protein PsYK624_008590 [Phanerochaete sordida]